MALAYLINRTARVSRRYQKSGQISIILLFIAAIIPDTDFIFYGFIGHHTVTHSIIFWSVAYPVHSLCIAPRKGAEAAGPDD